MAEFTTNLFLGDFDIFTTPSFLIENVFFPQTTISPDFAFETVPRNGDDFGTYLIAKMNRQMADWVSVNVRNAEIPIIKANRHLWIIMTIVSVQTSEIIF